MNSYDKLYEGLTGPSDFDEWDRTAVDAEVVDPNEREEPIDPESTEEYHRLNTPEGVLNAFRKLNEVDKETFLTYLYDYTGRAHE